MTGARTGHDWDGRVAAVLADPDLLTLVFQPVVSLQDAVVVGYEALSRFPGPHELTPDLWFAAADEQGRGAELEALVVRRCLSLRPSLPPNCFLTVNVSPHLLVDTPLGDLLLAAGDLRPLVLELTEHKAVEDLAPLVALRDRLAGSGALLALDDAGSGYSGLQQMTQFRPHLIKLDRALVAGADRDEVKLALTELLGEFAGRIDAWLLAEGIETWGELEAFQRLQVPLGQGYLLGRPAPPWSRLDPATAQRLRLGAARARLIEHVASLVEPVPGRRGGPRGAAAPAPGRAHVRPRTCRSLIAGGRAGPDPRGPPLKQFSCGDVVPGCRRTFSGSEAEILSAVAAHAHADHGLASIPDTLVEQVRDRMVAA